MQIPPQALRLTSTLRRDASLEIRLEPAPVAAPGPAEVVVRVEAAPINPSDLLTLLASADPAQARFEGDGAQACVVARLSPAAARARAARYDAPLGVGLEGAGVVVAAGEEAAHLIGKTVAVLTLARNVFAEYVTVPAAACVPLPQRMAPREGAALFVNPLTALAIAETVRLEGHAGLVHTAAASNLGQMLVKICLEDDLPLVNVVRRPEQVAMLRALGAIHVCDSSAASFEDDLAQALEATGATVLFDAIGGGSMAGRILLAMENAAAARLPEYSPYGSSERKQVYVYGHLDPSPMELLHDSYGLIWAVDGWVMPAILERAGPERAAALQQRALSGLRSTFASRFTREISLAEALQRDVMVAYSRQTTGEKFLINPTL